MADDEREMFDSALDNPVEQPDNQPRDEQGRFAPKAGEQLEEQPAEQPVEQPAPAQSEQQVEQLPQDPKDQGIPPWRLREEAEARRAAEARAQQIEQAYAAAQRQLAQMQEQSKPKQVPDIFEDPSAFVSHGVQSAVDPIKSEVSQLREFYSRRDAVREHGEEKVVAAYKALDQAARAGDPEAVMTVQRVRKSMDPFGDIMGWHTTRSLVSTVGRDPNAWFEKQMEERLKDPAFQTKLIERMRGDAQSRPSVTQLPPSLNKATSALSPQPDEDNSDAGLLRDALRR